jgi:hypothetical protein
VGLLKRFGLVEAGKHETILVEAAVSAPSGSTETPAENAPSALMLKFREMSSQLSARKMQEAGLGFFQLHAHRPCVFFLLNVPYMVTTAQLKQLVQAHAEVPAKSSPAGSDGQEAASAVVAVEQSIDRTRAVVQVTSESLAAKLAQSLQGCDTLHDKPAVPASEVVHAASSKPQALRTEYFGSLSQASGSGARRLTGGAKSKVPHLLSDKEKKRENRLMIHTLYIGNLPYDYGKATLSALLEGYTGTADAVADIRVPLDAVTLRSKGFAHVDFFEERYSKLIFDKLHGVKVQGRPLIVERTAVERTR